MGPLLIIALIIWAISAIGLIVLVLMHSGKGTGLSETFGGAMDTNLGTGVIEKNLNRMTIVFASVFVLSLIAMMFIWPSTGAQLSAEEAMEAYDEPEFDTTVTDQTYEIDPETGELVESPQTVNPDDDFIEHGEEWADDVFAEDAEDGTTPSF